MVAQAFQPAKEMKEESLRYRLRLMYRIAHVQCLDDAPGTVERDGDDINTDEAIGMIGVRVDEGGDGMEEALRLDTDDRLCRRAVPYLRAYTNLDTDKNVTIERDEIKFAAPAVPVARDDMAARCFEQEGGDPLAARPDGSIARRWLRHRAAMPLAPLAGAMMSSGAATSG